MLNEWEKGYIVVPRLMGISEGYCHKLLKKLANKEWITLKKLAGGSRIWVNGYSDFIQGKYPGQKGEKAKKLTPHKAFARYLKAIQEGQYLSASDLDF